MYQKPIIIVGTGRCGSTILTKILHKHKDILSLSECWPQRVNLPKIFKKRIYTAKHFWQLLSKPMADDMYNIALQYRIREVPEIAVKERIYFKRIALPTLDDNYSDLYNELERAFLKSQPAYPAEHIHIIFNYLKMRFNKKIWVERSGGNIDYLHKLYEMWPDIKIIHMYRNGIDCSISMLHHKAYRLIILRKNKNRNSNFYNIIPLTGDTNSINIDQHIPVNRFGMLWSEMILNGLNTLIKIKPCNIFNVSYEMFCADPKTTLTKILSFIDPQLIDLNFVNEYFSTINKRSSYNITIDQKASLHSACRIAQEALDEFILTANCFNHET